MNNPILLTLKRKLDELADEHENIGVKTQRNVLKEELQYYILNFIYHHPEYSNWTMYGGSALRICHKLNRMSVDLDFEITNPVSEVFLNNLKKEIELYFLNTHNTDSKLLTVKKRGTRGLRLNFHVGDEIGLNHPSKQIQVKIDLNHFVAPKTVTDRIPINNDQLSFVIKAYNMSALMASKIAAIFLREEFIVGKESYKYKGRDIYDLLWYMGKNATPDFDYLVAKGIDVKDHKTLFNKITAEVLNYEKMDNLLKEDLKPLFVNQTYIENWLETWRETYLQRLDDYKIHTITTLKKIIVSQDFHTDNFSFHFRYDTEEDSPVTITYVISDYWVGFEKSVAINEKIADMIEFKSDGISDKPELKQLATIFNDKNEDYLKKTNHIMLGEIIKTKIIRLTADNLNTKEQILLNKSALLSCELEDLLK